jgi:hypothetical protein
MNSWTSLVRVCAMTRSPCFVIIEWTHLGRYAKFHLTFGVVLLTVV